jgi:hypothetical protein
MAVNHERPDIGRRAYSLPARTGRPSHFFLAECCGCVTVLSLDPAMLFIWASLGWGPAI